MRYSDWQLNRLRDALRAYHRYGRSHDGEYFNWKDVSAAIEESGSAAIPPERLRQFVEGINAKDGGRKFPVPQDEWLAAIAAFATHEDNALLTDAELKEHMPSWHAAQRLLEYLGQSFDRERALPPATLAGTYQRRLARIDDFAVTELTLQRPSDDGLIQVVKTEESYPPGAAALIDGWSPAERREARTGYVFFGGWAAFTPEDNVFVFLKQERSGRNQYYFTLASDLTYLPEQPLRRLVFLQHDYPLEPEARTGDNADNLGAILSATEKNMIVFQRVS
jgi:hypothetical protein